MIRSHEEPEYPRVGQPLENYVLGNRKKILKTVYRGHIILSKNEGKFIEPDFDSESKCLAHSAELVVEMRKNGNN
jgi:hypothetical protein